MGRGLVERFPEAKSFFDRASEVLGYDLFELCQTGPEEKLHATNHSQPALFVHSMASLASLLATQPDLMSSVVAVAGLSLGEYSALAAAGVVSFEDGVRLVQERGLAMQAAAESVPSGMASVIGLSNEQVQELCDKARLNGEILQIANLLCPGNIAISGHAASIQNAEKMSSEMGATKFIRLPVAGAFHTAIMNAASERLKKALQSVAMQTATVGLISNVDASNHSSPNEFRDLLARQLVSPVRWEESLRNILAAGADQFYEVGSGRVLAGTLKRVDRKAACECIGD